MSPTTRAQPKIIGGHPVLDLLAKRIADGSAPRHRSDEARLALVIEGGGMRGVVAGGMVTALDELGLQEAFDLVIGTSAGALAGAFFLASQTHMGTSIYYEDLTGREWLDYRRALRGSPIVALDYLLDELMVNHKVLDCARVRYSDVPLYSVATRVPDYVPEVLGDFKTDEELICALRASARIPIVAGKPVSLRGSRYIDGSLSEAIPLDAALDLGATHLLVLLTRPRGQVRGYPGRMQRHFAFPMMNRLQSGLGDAYEMRAPRYAAALAQLEALQAKSAGGGGGAHARQLPPESTLVGQLEQDPQVLHAAANAGAAAVYKALTGAEREVFSALKEEG
jgi:predicted patatin/cPLA2 family phospholipase